MYVFSLLIVRLQFSSTFKKKNIGLLFSVSLISISGNNAKILARSTIERIEECRAILLDYEIIAIYFPLRSGKENTILFYQLCSTLSAL
jgi:hypothetical protein